MGTISAERLNSNLKVPLDQQAGAATETPRSLPQLSEKKLHALKKTTLKVKGKHCLEWL